MIFALCNRCNVSDNVPLSAIWVCILSLLIKPHAVLRCFKGQTVNKSCPAKAKRTFFPIHSAYQIFNVCSCNFTGISLNHIKRQNLIYCCCFWPKLRAPLQNLDMNSRTLWRLLGDWTVGEVWLTEFLSRPDICLVWHQRWKARKQAKILGRVKAISGSACQVLCLMI